MQYKVLITSKLKKQIKLLKHVSNAVKRKIKRGDHDVCNGEGDPQANFRLFASLLFSKPFFCSSKLFPCSLQSNMPSGTRNAPFKAPIPRFKLFLKRSVSGTMLTRPVQWLTRVVFLCDCEVE